MNRDESIHRPIAHPPRLDRIGAVSSVYPREPAGGSWVLLNGRGLAFGLLNWYPVATRVTGQARSRGQIVLEMAQTRSSLEARRRLASLALPRFNPFRLIIVDPHEQRIWECRWDLRSFRALSHKWDPQIWASSGFDESGAQSVRNAHFQRALGQGSAGTVEWMRRLHRSRRPKWGPYSICMRRPDARTVSYTEISVTRLRGRMGYMDGWPRPGTPRSRSLSLSKA